MAEIQLKRLAGRRRLINGATAQLVRLGGGVAIGAIALIFFYLLWVVAPIFAGAQVDHVASYPLPADAVAVEIDENSEIGIVFQRSGALRFFDLNDGVLGQEVVTGGSSIERVRRVYPGNNLYAVLGTDGRVRFLETRFPVDFDTGQRRVQPTVAWPFEDQDESIAIGTVDDFDVYRDDDNLVIASLSGGSLSVISYEDAEQGYPLEFPDQADLSVSPGFDRVLFGPRGEWLYLLNPDGEVQLVARIGRNLTPSYTGRLVAEGVRLTALQPLLGRYSLMVADDRGALTQWFLVRGESGYQLQAARSFQFDHPIVRIEPERRRKGLLAIDASATLHVLYSTSERMLTSIALAEMPDRVALAPRANRLLTQTGAQAAVFEIDNAHPEISWGTLWRKIWYEGYPEPVYSWQSSSADNDFEPKFSLTPLLFGTLKAAFYAMVLAMPIAIMGAAYTAYFMTPGMRRWVKPGIEIMSALPTVILGFIAGLWLAPLVEDNLAAVLGMMLLLPPGMFLFAWIWHLLPDRLTGRQAGWYGAISVPLLLLMGYLSFSAGPVVENVLFDDDLQGWFLDNWGLGYDQRNALVVGLAMGMAIVPTIFAIAEDAIYGVPQHLINGSLALGATPWQTLIRVVILTASPGIFSAVMIGLGRGVGETMIVLMATGNTAVMDLNMFQGMRTFAANIAVELPESEVDSSHYRILFLAALVLFLITFAFNTVAELVRQRLRARYGSL